MCVPRRTSQAIYCLEWPNKTARPLRDGLMVGQHVVLLWITRKHRPASHRTLRDGTVVRSFQAINCLATITLSLRDKNRTGS